MNFRTFFTLLFIISVSSCILATYYPNEFNNILQNINIDNNKKFIGLLSLIIAIISYLGMLTSFYFAHKREKLRIRKLEEDRVNIDKIHAELKSLLKKNNL